MEKPTMEPPSCSHFPGKRGCLRNLDLHHGRRSQGTFYSQRQRPVRGGRTGNLRLSRPVLLLRRAGRKRLLTISQAASSEDSPENTRSVSLLLRSASGEFPLQGYSGITEETLTETEASRDFSYLGGIPEEVPARDFSYLGVPEESTAEAETAETSDGQSGQNE